MSAIRLYVAAFVAMLSVALASPASAQAIPHGALGRAQADRWEMTYLALSAIDTAQTIDCIGRGECEEANPLFGKHPKAGRLIAAKLLLGGLHFAAFRALEAKNPRGAMRFAQGSVLVQGGVVLLNARFMF